MFRRSEKPAGGRTYLAASAAGLLVLMMTLCFSVYAHPDLQLQIDELTEKIELEPGNVDLLLKRGDLQRRHQNWDLARADFGRIREIQPENRSVDWFEGRMEVQAGQPVVGLRYLDRFLLNNPEHAIALQNRAQAYLLVNRPLLAAQDFHEVIKLSERPAPSLYRANALALVAAGEDHYSTAAKVVENGLLIFPGEVTLTAIATDLYLVQSDTDAAGMLIDQLPASIQKLPQWQTRIALLNCQSGKQSSASEWFAHANDTVSLSRNEPGPLSAQWLDLLARQPLAENCRAAAREILKNH